MPRWVRLLPLVLLAAIGFDLADGDCAKGSASSAGPPAAVADETLADANPVGDCACCVVSEAAEDVFASGAADLRTAAALPASRRTCTGVRPAPYRPPLSLS